MVTKPKNPGRDATRRTDFRCHDSHVIYSRLKYVAGWIRHLWCGRMDPASLIFVDLYYIFSPSGNAICKCMHFGMVTYSYWNMWPDGSGISDVVCRFLLYFQSDIFSVRQFQSGISPSVCRIISVRLDVLIFSPAVSVWHQIISVRLDVHEPKKSGTFRLSFLLFWKC